MKVNWSDNFESVYKERGHQKYGIRLLALWKIQSGISETAVCKIIGKTPKTIRFWRRLYEEGGIDKLLSRRPGCGKKPRLPLCALVVKEIEALQETRSGGRINCQSIVDMVFEKYNIHYSASGMYKVLKRLGFSWITSRSKHPKQNLQAQEDFKKNFLKKLSRLSPQKFV